MPEQEIFRAGSTIIRQGKSGNTFYVLEKGSVEVIKDELVLNVLIYPGTIFGELSAIQGTPRTSHVRARTETTVQKYTVNDLKEFILEEPELAAKMLQTLANRLQHTTQKLADSM